MKEPLTLLGLSILCLILFMTNIYQWQSSKALKQASDQPYHPIKLEEAITQKMKGAENNESHKKKHTTKEIDLIKTPKPPETGIEQKIINDHVLAQLIASPEMKKAMRAQQHLIIEKSYRNFLKQVDISSQEKEDLMELMSKDQMQEFELVQHLFSRQSNKESKQDDTIKEEIKTILSEGKYIQYQTYQKTIPERMTVEEFVNQMSSSDVPLQLSQKESLTQILVEKYEYNPLNRMSPSKALGAMLESEKTMNDYFAKQRSLNEQILLRAQTILNESQLKRFKVYQDHLLTEQEANLKMLKSRSDKP